jgi:hypothetical protein
MENKLLIGRRSMLLFAILVLAAFLAGCGGGSSWLTAMGGNAGALSGSGKYLPFNRELTVRLSTVTADGILMQVADARATPDALGKIRFTFAFIPDSTVASFLHVQIIDGNAVLRQGIVPAPSPGGTIETGISEVTDVQARVALKTAAVSGRLNSLHLLLAQTMFRSPGFSQSDTEMGGAAVAAAAEALEGVITTDSGGAGRLPAFMKAIAEGLGDAAALYRHSVDDAVWFDEKVEAYRRGETLAMLMQSFVNAGANAGIPLDTLSTAFVAAGAAAEASLVDLSPAAIEAVRAGFITGMVQCGVNRYVRERADALTAVGVFPGRFGKVSAELYRLREIMMYYQKSEEGTLFGTSVLPNQLVAVGGEFNAFAQRDLTFLKYALELGSDWDVDPSSECALFLAEVAARMSAAGGIMSGTTPETLKAFFDNDTQPGQYQIAAWRFLTPSSPFSYSPVPGLAEQLTSPPSPPDVGQLAGPYRDMALLGYDMTLLAMIRQAEFLAAENALPTDPPSWLSLDTVRRLNDNDLQRRAAVRQRIGGIDPATSRAIMNLLQSPIEVATEVI